MAMFLVLYSSPVPVADMTANATPEEATFGGAIDAPEILAMPGM